MLSNAPKAIRNEMKLEVKPYDELIRSLEENERKYVLAELDSREIISRAKLLCKQLVSNENVGLNLDESRILFLAALRNLKLGKITVAQLASMHFFDSAIRTLYTNPYVYLIHKFVEDNKVQRTANIFPLSHVEGLPTSISWYTYDTLVVPKDGTEVSDLPHRMQKPLMQRYFNFSDSEWDNFCNEMSKASPSEQIFKVLIAPEHGCYSSIISLIQKLLKCMHVLDYFVDSEEGLTIENIILVPSFTMLQAGLNAKAITLNRTPVELIPTYGYINENHYTELKATGKIAFALYMPEKNSKQRYNLGSGKFRVTIDGHGAETAFGGAIHDVYHAMREMAMSENVAKARMRLVSIAKKHPNNRNSTKRSVAEILIDGELIYSYPLSLDTMFDPEHRPLNAEIFGDIFYTSALKGVLHENLKRAFIEDMVVNEKLWQTQFKIGKTDLRKKDQDIFDELKAQRVKTNNVVSFSPAKAMTKVGLLSSSSQKKKSSHSSSVNVVRKHFSNS